MTHEKKAVALTSVFASAAMSVGKFIVGFATGSLGLISEGLHSLLDLGTAMMTYFAVSVSDKPADEKHPYGHSKIESVTALIGTGLLFLTAIGIFYEAVQRLFGDHPQVEVNGWSVGVIIASILIDISRSRALKRVASKTNSQALEADALHFESDVLSSCVVLAGLGFVAFGWPMGDSLAAIGVSFFVAHAGYDLGKRTIDSLIDAAPAGAMDRVTAIAEQVDGVAAIGRVRVRSAGHVTFVDIDINVGRGLSLDQVAAVQARVEKAVTDNLPGAQVNIVASPLALDSETLYDRVQIIAARLGLPVHHVTIQTISGRLSVSLDMEVDGQQSLGQAHDTATQLEDMIRGEFGGGIEVETHIEPLQLASNVGEDVAPDRLADIEQMMQGLCQKTDFLRQLHGVRVRQTDIGLFVIFHCRVDPSIRLADVHTAVDGLERAIQAACPEIRRIVGHAEPLKA
jgi:cation diffusion facilitator family transporter